MTYRKYKYNVIKAWVEIPEMYDEIWERHYPDETRISERKSVLNAADRSTSSGAGVRPRLALRRESIKVLKQLKRSIENVRRMDSQEQHHRSEDTAKESQTDTLLFTDFTITTDTPPPRTHKFNPKINSPMEPEQTLPDTVHTATDDATRKSEDTDAKSIKKGWSMLRKGVTSGTKRPMLHKGSSWQRYSDKDGNTEHNSKPKKTFNYEKYLKYLEVILDTIGFSVAGVMVTWDRTSFFCVILVTLVGVFAQAAFLKK